MYLFVDIINAPMSLSNRLVHVHSCPGLFIFAHTCNISRRHFVCTSGFNIM